MMDFEVQHCTRQCAASGRELRPGEEFYSALVGEGAEVRRLDYATDAWQGPPEGTIGWWKSRIPDRNAQRMRWAPNDVMLHFFEELLDQPDKEDLRYVLALLLVRRRVMRHEETERDDEGRETLALYCPRNENTYRVPVVMPDESRAEEIQQELARLLE